MKLGSFLYLALALCHLQVTIANDCGLFCFFPKGPSSCQVTEVEYTEETVQDNVRGRKKIAIRGNTAAVAKWLGPVLGNKVIVYTRSDEQVWTEVAQLTPSNTLDALGFAVSVAIDEGERTIFVGTNSLGRIIVFSGSGDVWIEQQTLSACTTLYSRVESLAVNGGSLVAGMPSGILATVYKKNGEAWEKDADLLPEDTLFNSFRYGESVGC